MQNEIAIKLTIWNEGRHEKLQPNVAAIYPSGIHGAIAAGLQNEGFAIPYGRLDDPDQGLGEELLDDTDVTALFASVMGVECQHLAVLRAVGALLAGGDAGSALIAIPTDVASLPAAAGSVAFPDAIPPVDMASPPAEGAVA